MSTTDTPPVAGALDDVAPPRRPWRSRLSGGHVLMLVAGLTAMLLNYAVLRAHDGRVAVVVTGRDVAAGEEIGAADLAFADVRASEALLATLITREQRDQAVGQVATVALPAGTLVRRDDLAPAAAGDGRRAMSIPIEPEHAVAGRLDAGDRVDVIEVRDGRAAFLLTDAPVLHVTTPDARGGLTGPRAFSVTVALDDEHALRLALAIRDGDLEVVRSTGARAPRLQQVEGATAGQVERAAGGSAVPGAEDPAR